MAVKFKRTDGVYSPNSSLTVEQVQQIRAEYDQGMRGKASASNFDIHPVSYNRVGRREVYKNVPEENNLIFAIDAGTYQSAYVRTDLNKITSKGIVPNEMLCVMLRHLSPSDNVALEMIASYGMPVGKEVFETCLWIGRFIEAYESTHDKKACLIYRKDVKMELCGTMKAKDANIRAALIDIFPQSGGGKVPAIGTKADQGELYGMKSHMWSALAVAFCFDKQSSN